MGGNGRNVTPRSAAPAPAAPVAAPARKPARYFDFKCKVWSPYARRSHYGDNVPSNGTTCTVTMKYVAGGCYGRHWSLKIQSRQEQESYIIVPSGSQNMLRIDPDSSMPLWTGYQQPMWYEDAGKVVLYFKHPRDRPSKS